MSKFYSTKKINISNGVNKKIFIIAGEASGDLHGSLLVKSIKELFDDVEFFGMGGEAMRQAGVKLIFNSSELAVTGFTEVLKSLNKFRRVFQLLSKKLEEVQPDCVILIDYPGFNLRFAKKVKELNLKLIYYISPQVWAWGKNRVKTIRRFVDRMLVVFKFEEDFYKEFNINTDFIGHPLMDKLFDYKKDKQELLKRFSLEEKDKKIVLLPGSRENEVKKILPIMLKSAFILQTKIKDAKFLLATTSSVKKETYLEITKNYSLNNLIWCEDKSYDCLYVSDFAFVCSGTATLETAIFRKPMAIIYKMSFLSYLIIKSLIKVPSIGLVNLVGNKKIVPEFIQFNAKPNKIADFAFKVLTDSRLNEKIEANLAEVGKKLGPPGASQRAAKIIMETL